MVESNKVVIKINSPEVGGRLLKNKRPERVIEWHVKRIVMAVLLLLILILLPFYFFSGNSDPVSDELELKQVTLKPRETVKLIVKKQNLFIDTKSIVVDSIKSEEATVLEEKPVVDNRVVRALLTTGVREKEPVDRVILPVFVSKEQATAIYYFTEIINMKGQTLAHQWLWNDNIIYKRQISILGDRWRATTSKLISHTKTGVWSVRLVSKQGVVLNNIVFNVYLK